MGFIVNYKQTFCLFLLSVCVSWLSAQEDKMRFSHLTLSDGLAHSNVSSIAQDKDGFIWIGTFNGLSMYDASRMKNFSHHGDTTSLCHNNISNLALSNDHSMYVGMNSCISKYYPKERNFQSIHIDREESVLSRFSVSKMVAADHERDMWVSTMGAGLLYLNADQLTATPQEVRIDNELVTHCYGMIKDEQGKLWIGTADRVLVFSPKNRSTEQLFFYEEDERLASVGDVGAIMQDRQGQIWAGTNTKGIFKYNKARNRFEMFVYPDGKKRPFAAKVLSEDQGGSIWIGTDGEGLFILSADKIVQYVDDETDPYAISSSTIYTIFHSTDQTTWVGHFGGGVSIYNPNNLQFNTISRIQNNANSPTNSNIRSLYQDQTGTIWIGTRAGLTALDEKQWAFRRYPYQENSRYSLSAPIVLTMVEDGTDHLWIGTFGGGLNRLNKKTGVFEHFQIDDTRPNSITDNNVYSLLDLGDQLLVGTLSRLHLFHKKTAAFEVVEGVSFVRKLFNISDGSILLGTDQGLYTYDSSTKQLQKIWSDQNEWNDVQSIFEAKDGTLWIGTAGMGLLKMKSGIVDKTYGEQEGLPSNTVTGILEDEQGFLWLSTYNGLSQFDPVAERFKNFDESDGIQGLEYNSGAALKSRSGKMYFGGISGMDQFHPDHININAIPPKVLISELQLSKGKELLNDVDYFGKNIQQLSSVTFSPDVDRFTFYFSALNFVAPQKNSFAYRLKGFDDQWQLASYPQYSASYTNVPPGNYTLEVKAANNDGVWSKDVQSMKMFVQPPIWKTWYAMILYISIIIGLILLFNHFTLLNSRYKNQLSLAALESKKRVEMNQLKLAFFTNISHELRTPLTLILSPLERLINNTTNEHPNQVSYQLIQRNAQRLLELVNQLMDFRKIENHRMRLNCVQGDMIAHLSLLHKNFDDLAQHKNISYQFYHEVDELTCWFDPDAIEKITYNLLSNAFKFTPPKGKVSLFVTIEKVVDTKQTATPHLKMIVKDTGKGIEQDKIAHIFERFYVEPNTDQQYKGDTGIGLALVKSLVELHQGKIWVESEPDQGTRFHVLLPLIANPFQEKSPHISFQTEQRSPYASQLHPTTHQNSLSSQQPDVSSTNDGGKRPKLLVVEDNPDILTFIQNELNTHFDITTAQDGAEGFSVAKEKLPDIILSDVMMPNMDGFAFTELLKNHEMTSHIPIVLLTAKTDVVYQLQGLQLGVDDYIVKPFDIGLLHARLTNLLAIRAKMGRKNKQYFISDVSIDEIKSVDEKFMHKIVGILEEEVRNADFNIDLLASKMAVSRSVLYRKVKALTDSSPAEFIRSYKLRRAKKIIERRPALTISEVAFEVGFNDPKYFSKCFKKEYQLSPRQFADRVKEGKEDYQLS